MREIDNPRLAAALRRIPGIEKRTFIEVKIVAQKGTVAEIRASNREQFSRIATMAKSYPGGRIEYSARRMVRVPIVGEARVSQELGKGSDGFERALEVLGE